MSCIKKIKSEEISGSTFPGREISLIGDITDYTFIAKVKSSIQGKITEIVGIKNANKVFFPFESIKDLRNAKYIIEYWGDFTDLGNEPFLVEELNIVSPENASETCQNDPQIFEVKINNVTIPVTISKTITQIFLDFENLTEEQKAELKGEKGDKGDKGDNGEKGEKGDTGEKGEQGKPGDNGNNGNDGLSAYEIAVQSGFVGTELEWLASLRGADGNDGNNGEDGEDGADGKSAYEIAVANGFTGTESQWLLSLKGEKGDKGEQGVQGEKGDKGDKGEQGVQGVKGDTGPKGSDASVTKENISAALGFTPTKPLNIKITTPSNWVTGTMSETEVLKIPIVGGSINPSDIVKLQNLTITKEGTNGNLIVRGKLSTSATMPSGSTDQVFQSPSITSTNQYADLYRHFIIENGELKGFAFTSGAYTSQGTVNGNLISTRAFDVNQTYNLFISLTLGSGLDRARVESININNI